MKRRSWLDRRIDEDSDFAERFDREIKAARRRTAERIAARNLAAAYRPEVPDGR